MTIPPKSLMIGTCEIASHYPELSLNDAAGDALQLAEPSSHAWGSLKASFRKGKFPTVGETVDFSLSFHCVRLFLTQIGPPHGVAGTEGFGLSSLHACGKPYYSLSSRVLRTLFPTPVWETGCRGKTGGRKERRNIAFPTRVGETSFGSQYAHSYDFFPTRMGKPNEQARSVYLGEFLPYTYGEAPTLMPRPSPAMSSSLRVTGESLRRPATPEPEAGLPYMYGGSPRRRRGQHADGTVFPTCTGEFHQPSRSPCS